MRILYKFIVDLVSAIIWRHCLVRDGGWWLVYGQFFFLSFVVTFLQFKFLALPLRFVWRVTTFAGIWSRSWSVFVFLYEGLVDYWCFCVFVVAFVVIGSPITAIVVATLVRVLDDASVAATTKVFTKVSTIVIAVARVAT